MKYKIVISNGRNSIEAICCDAVINETMPIEIDSIDNIDSWFALNLLGVHVFETDDFEGFDLMEAQMQKDLFLTCINESVELQNIKTTIDDLDFKIKRKNEVRRVAELFCTVPDCINLESAVRNAIYFVDNFDAEFEKSEGEK